MKYSGKIFCWFLIFVLHPLLLLKYASTFYRLSSLLSHCYYYNIDLIKELFVFIGTPVRLAQTVEDQLVIQPATVE